MGLSSSDVLAIINLIFYTPVFPVAIFVVIQHGLKKSAGWVYLLVLAVLRLTGEPLTIAGGGGDDPANQLYRIGSILSSIGLTALLNAPLGVLSEVNAAMGILGGGSSSSSGRPPIPPRILHLAHLPSTIAIALYASGASNTDPAQAAQAQSHRSAGAAIFIVCWVLLALLALFMLGQVRSRLPKHSSISSSSGSEGRKRRGRGADGARLMVYAVLAALPFLLLRIAYTCVTAFGSLSIANNIVLKAILNSVMEWIVVLIFLVAGLRAEPLPRSEMAMAAPPPPAASAAGYGGPNHPISSPSYNHQQQQQRQQGPYTNVHDLGSSNGEEQLQHAPPAYQMENRPHTAAAADGAYYGHQQVNSSNGYDQRQQQQQDMYNYYSPEAVQQRQNQRGWQTQHTGLNDLYELGAKLGERLESRIERKMDRKLGRHAHGGRRSRSRH